MKTGPRRNDRHFVSAFPAAQVAKARSARRFRRIELQRPLRFVLPDGASRRGVMTDLSVRGISVLAPPAALVGDAIELFIADVGHLKGRVAGIRDHGFGVALTGTKTDRAALADRLTAVLNPETLAERALRFPAGHETVIESTTGEMAFGRIIDVSATGASVETELKVAIGQSVRVGHKRATVARVNGGTIGITFKRQNRASGNEHG